VCLRPQFVTVGDPTTTQVTDRGLVAPSVDHALTESEAWTAVALTTLGAILVWIDTGRASFMMVPVFLLLFFSLEEK